jgi:hypothetical protein
MDTADCDAPTVAEIGERLPFCGRARAAAAAADEAAAGDGGWRFAELVGG